MFKDKDEFARAMMENSRFEHAGEIAYRDKTSEFSPFLIKSKGENDSEGTEMSSSWDLYDKVTEVFEPRWEDGLKYKPQLCWIAIVETPILTEIDIITSFVDFDNYPYKTNNEKFGGWKYAKPLSDKEIIKFLDGDYVKS